MLCMYKVSCTRVLAGLGLEGSWHETNQTFCRVCIKPSSQTGDFARLKEEILLGQKWDPYRVFRLTGSPDAHGCCLAPILPFGLQLDYTLTLFSLTSSPYA